MLEGSETGRSLKRCKMNAAGAWCSLQKAGMSDTRARPMEHQPMGQHSEDHEELHQGQPAVCDGHSHLEAADDPRRPHLRKGAKGSTPKPKKAQPKPGAGGRVGLCSNRAFNMFPRHTAWAR